MNHNLNLTNYTNSPASSRIIGLLSSTFGRSALTISSINQSINPLPLSPSLAAWRAISVRCTEARPKGADDHHRGRYIYAGQSETQRDKAPGRFLEIKVFPGARARECAQASGEERKRSWWLSYFAPREFVSLSLSLFPRCTREWRKINRGLRAEWFRARWRAGDKQTLTRATLARDDGTPREAEVASRVPPRLFRADANVIVRFD